MPEPEAGTEPDLWRDLGPWLDQELSRLPDKYRVAIALCDLEGKTRKEAARQLKIPEGTLSSRLTTARTKLAKRLARHGLAVAGGSVAALLSQEAALASVPASVLSATIKAVTLVAAGEVAATGLISAKVAALTEGVVKAMLLTKLKTVTAVLLTLSLVTLTSVLLAWGQTRDKGDSVEKPAAKAEKQPAKQAANPKEAESDSKLLEGSWKVVALEADGKKVKVPPEALKGGRWSFKGSELQISEPGVKSDGKSSVKLNSSKTPKHIDLVVPEGPQKGKTMQGIFKFEKDRLVICLRGLEAAEKGRPKEFMTEADSGLGMITLERAQE